MHIAEGILPAPILIGGAAIAAVAVGIGLRKLDEETFVKTSVLTSAFFVASLIHVPLPPTSVHLVLNGLTGLLLGWAVFPAVAVGLLLQAVLFGFGGLTTLGVNTLVMALPGFVCHVLFFRLIQSGTHRRAIMLGFVAGAGAIAIAALSQAIVLMTAGRAFLYIAGYILAAHVPVMIIEGFVTASAVGFLHRVRPETFASPIAKSPVEA